MLQDTDQFVIYCPDSPPRERAILRGGNEVAVCNVWGECGISFAKMVEPIELPFGMASGVDTRNRILDRHAQWRHRVSAVKRLYARAWRRGLFPKEIIQLWHVIVGGQLETTAVLAEVCSFLAACIVLYSCRSCCILSLKQPDANTHTHNK